MTLLKNKHVWITALSALAVGIYLLLGWLSESSVGMRQAILITVIVIGGIPLIIDIIKDLLRGELGADAIAGISIITALFLKEYLAGVIIVFMLSGGALLENYAVHNASSVLNALLKRMPKMAHRKSGDGLTDIEVGSIKIGDIIVIFPHDIAPVDGVVMEGHGTMDESFLTGEPFHMSKAPGSEIYSGAINGESALTLRATKLPTDSRYAKITEIMRAAEEKRPRLRRLADQFGRYYTPFALIVGGAAWYFSGDPVRFLAVIVVATPCPLIIGIPITIIGAISLAARRGIIVKNPLALEQIQLCRTAIYDKTGTLTYGHATLVEQDVVEGFVSSDVLQRVASLERYSKHPLAQAITRAAEEAKLPNLDVSEISEKPGQGLQGRLGDQRLQILGRKQLLALRLLTESQLPDVSGGLECFVMVDGQYAARYRFRDAPRSDSPKFIQHLGPRHAFERQMIISGDRESEVRYLAEAVGIENIHAGQSPEEKLALVRIETARAKTLYIGDGINDAPALLAATVGLAIGQNSDVTSEAASVVVMEGSLQKVDEFIHISKRMRRIAMQCAIGGILLSTAGMIVAAFGGLSPVRGAIVQEIIDLIAIGNALRAAWPPKQLTDI